jgi:hypothetical protein
VVCAGLCIGAESLLQSPVYTLDPRPLDGVRQRTVLDVGVPAAAPGPGYGATGRHTKRIISQRYSLHSCSRYADVSDSNDSMQRSEANHASGWEMTATLQVQARASSYRQQHIS